MPNERQQLEAAIRRVFPEAQAFIAFIRLDEGQIKTIGDRDRYLLEYASVQTMGLAIREQADDAIDQLAKEMN